MKKAFLSALIVAILLTACGGTPPVESTPTPEPSPTLTSTATPEPIPTQTEVPPTATPTEIASYPVTIALEPQLEERTAEILSEFAPEYLDWTLLTSDDPAAELDNLNADLALFWGEDGILIDKEPIAFTVPFVSSLEMITYQEALEIFENGDYTIEVELWSEMDSNRKALSIGGVSPQDEGYLFNKELVLAERLGLEETAFFVAQILQQGFAEDKVVHLAAVGDVMLDHGLGEQLLLGYTHYPFGQVADYLQSADITVGNFESAMTTIGEPQDKVYVFNAPLNAVDALLYGGFDLMTLANNHALDYGPEALMQAIDILNSNGIETFGAGIDFEETYAPAIVDVNGIKIAFLGYLNSAEEISGHNPSDDIASEEAPGVAWGTADYIYSDVTVIKDQVDLVVVVLHSGLEYCETPSPTQFTLSHTAINAGADIVIGHHAHTLQGVEFYNGGVIVYGLGNFAFQDDIIYGKTCGSTTYSYRSAILNVYLDQDGVREIEFMPVVLDESGRPFPAYGEDADAILSRIYLLSQYLD